MQPDPGELPVKIRSFKPSDQPDCRKLYVEGLIGGSLAANDTGLDIDDITQAYMTEGNHFWVAEGPDGHVVGMVGVQHHDQDVGEIRRLRVRQNSQRRGIGSKLLETAVRFCVERNYLKVALDTWVERDSAIRLFQKHHFRHERTKSVAGRELLYFYLDLYSGDHRPQRKD